MNDEKQKKFVEYLKKNDPELLKKARDFQMFAKDLLLKEGVSIKEHKRR